MKSKLIGIAGGIIVLVAVILAWFVTNISGFGSPASGFLTLFTKTSWPWLGVLAFLGLAGVVLSAISRNIIERSILITIGFLLIGVSIYQYFAIERFMNVHALLGLILEYLYISGGFTKLIFVD